VGFRVCFHHLDRGDLDDLCEPMFKPKQLQCAIGARKLWVGKLSGKGVADCERPRQGFGRGGDGLKEVC
jgi:hypothetical protein